MIGVDVSGGTGFTIFGMVKHVDAKNVTILDQSPHLLVKAKQKKPLKDCKIIECDAEDLPFRTDCADRYVSAVGLHNLDMKALNLHRSSLSSCWEKMLSMEYWPDPQRGINRSLLGS